MLSWLELAELADEWDSGAAFDPLCVERSAPVDDDEAALMETICREATPGPLAIEDSADGERAPVVSLPDGRLVVSLTASVEQANDDSIREANAQLICKARHFLLRLLRDRRQWQQQHDRLQQRIRTLESRLRPESPAVPGPGPRHGSSQVRRPR